MPYSRATFSRALRLAFLFNSFEMMWSFLLACIPTFVIEQMSPYVAMLRFSSCTCCLLNVAITKFLWICFSLNYSSLLWTSSTILGGGGVSCSFSVTLTVGKCFFKWRGFALSVAKASNHERRSRSNEPITM